MLTAVENEATQRPHPPSAANSIRVPCGAWDCHAHVVGEPARYPFVADRAYTPSSFAVEDFLNVLDVAGVDFGVLVQISVHGTDNSALIDALRKAPDRLVGIAVIDKQTSDAEMDALRRQGVRGIRLLEMAGGVGLEDLEYFASRCAEVGWHIELCAPAARLHELEDRLNKITIPVVLDHCGKFEVEAGEDDSHFRFLQRYMARTNVWMKLAGYYRESAEPGTYSDVLPFLSKLVDVAPDRLVWGSDWPNVCCPAQQLPHYGRLLDIFSAIATGQQRQAIFSSNPMRLYRRTEGSL